jgi:hypothetical protein
MSMLIARSLRSISRGAFNSDDVMRRRSINKRTVYLRARACARVYNAQRPQFPDFMNISSWFDTRLEMASLRGFNEEA